MDPFHEEQKRKTEASLISVALTLAFSILGIYNWMELRTFVVSMLASWKVDPFAWQAIDNFSFLIAGILWLAYVFFSQFYLKKHALKRRLLPKAALLLAVQLWLLFLCRGVPALLGDSTRAHGIPIVVEGILALLLTAYVLTTMRSRQNTGINFKERG